MCTTMHDNEIRREKNVLKIKFIVGVDRAFVRLVALLVVSELES